MVRVPGVIIVFVKFIVKISLFVLLKISYSEFYFHTGEVVEKCFFWNASIEKLLINSLLLAFSTIFILPMWKLILWPATLIITRRVLQ